MHLYCIFVISSQRSSSKIDSTELGYYSLNTGYLATNSDQAYKWPCSWLHTEVLDSIHWGHKSRRTSRACGTLVSTDPRS